MSPIKTRENTTADQSQSFDKVAAKLLPPAIYPGVKKKFDPTQLIYSHLVPDPHKRAIKPGDVEQTLRQLLDMPDAQVFDCHMIL